MVSYNTYWSQLATRYNTDYKNDSIEKIGSVIELDIIQWRV
jgi:hypothetical protein